MNLLRKKHCYLLLLMIIVTSVVGISKNLNPDDTVIKDNVDDRYSRLTDDDYAKVAAELDIDVATIKAVSDIEAGKTHNGFATPGVPIINFDVTVFRGFLRKAGINAAKYKKSNSTAFSRVNTAKYGSYAKAQYARLESAREINADIANKSTFWGMFQIGGFNWKKCGTSSIDEYVTLVSQSEAMQLELFARFLENSGMVKYLKTKNWRAFAKAYNGTSAIARGYHKRLASAYAKYSR
ncbi:MAG: N-acetylmuramidase family protein [Muribaculaceae bacterium]